VQLVLWFKAAPVVGGAMTTSHLGALRGAASADFSQSR
jgi:hypothetical protein